MALCSSVRGAPCSVGSRALPRRRLQRLVSVGLIFGMLGLGLARCSQLSGDEILCEEAFAKLKECCGESEALSMLGCAYSDSVGGCAPTRPNISHDDSLCLLNHSCDLIRSANICNSQMWTPMENCGECTLSDGTQKTCCSTWEEPTCSLP
jgi:hypothetical protein